MEMMHPLLWDTDVPVVLGINWQPMEDLVKKLKNSFSTHNKSSSEDSSLIMNILIPFPMQLFPSSVDLLDLLGWTLMQSLITSTTQMLSWM